MLFITVRLVKREIAGLPDNSGLRRATCTCWAKVLLRPEFSHTGFSPCLF
jgi:hypothetical protein